MTDPAEAEYQQGLCRRVENLSGAEAVYEYARQFVVKVGRGFWRIRHVEREDDPFAYDVRIEPCLNLHSVYHDPRCRMLDFSDARFAHITDDLTWDDFTAQFPHAKHKTAEGFRSLGDEQKPWLHNAGPRVVERYWIELRDVTFCKLSDGRVVEKGKDPVDYDAAPPPLPPPVAQGSILGLSQPPMRPYVVAEATKKRPAVRWMKFTAAEILELADVPGTLIPVVKVVGARRVIDNKVDYRGMVRPAMEPSRIADFMESRLAQAVDEASYDTWLASVEATEGLGEWWKDIAAERPSTLLYRERGQDGQPLSKPERISSAPLVQPIAIAAQRAAMLIRHAVGMPDVTPEELKPEQSGVAIRRRQQQQEQGTSHYAKGVGLGIALTGRIIGEYARVVYDVPTVLRIMGADEKEAEIVAYAGRGNKEAAEQKLAELKQRDPKVAAGVRGVFDVAGSRFNYTVTAGRNNATARQDAVDATTAAVQAFPPIAPKVLPVLFKNSDWPGAQEIAKSLEPDPAAGTVPVEQVKQLQQQGQQVIDALTAELKQLQAEQQAQREKNASAERISAADNATKLQIEAMRIEADFKLQMAKAQMEHERSIREADQRDQEMAIRAAEPQGQVQ